MKRKLANHYNGYDYPRYWDNREYEDEAERIALKKFFKKIDLDTNDKIADIGCGFGRLVDTYLEYTQDILLVDPSAELLEKAKSKHKKQKKISYKCLDVDNLELIQKQTLDLVLMIRVLHHVEDVDSAFKSVNRILKKDGYFILEFANKLHGKDQLKNILKGNFTYPLDIFPVDKRSNKNKKNNSINFLNHHPDIIRKSLKDNGFEIIDSLSVSNFRSNLIKSNMPKDILLNIEDKLQKPFSYINFGPSSFILGRKIQ